MIHEEFRALHHWDSFFFFFWICLFFKTDNLGKTLHKGARWSKIIDQWKPSSACKAPPPRKFALLQVFFHLNDLFVCFFKCVWLSFANYYVFTFRFMYFWRGRKKSGVKKKKTQCFFSYAVFHSACVTRGCVWDELTTTADTPLAAAGARQTPLLGLAAPSLRWQTWPPQPHVSNDGQASAVAENGEEGSSGALFMWLGNWPAADCSGEIAVGLKYTSSSHTARRLQVSTRSPLSFCFHSSLRLRRPGLNTRFPHVYQIELYRMQRPTC